MVFRGKLCGKLLFLFAIIILSEFLSCVSCVCSTFPFLIQTGIWKRALLVLVSVPGTVNSGGLNLELEA